MFSENVSDLVYRIERIASSSQMDAVVLNQVPIFLECHRYKPSKNIAYSDDERRGLLLCAKDLLNPAHPRRELLTGAIMAAMVQSAERERTG